MGTGRVEDVADQRKEMIALIAVMGGEGRLTADYRIADGATLDERHEIAEKLREIAARVESIGGGRCPPLASR